MTFAKALRSAMSPPEVRLWLRLRSLRPQGLRFRRQHPIGPYVLDFYCPATKLAVEIDGFGHAMDNQGTRDERRDAWLGARGIQVVRLQAMQVLKEPDSVTDMLCRMAVKPPQSASPTALP